MIIALADAADIGAIILIPIVIKAGAAVGAFVASRKGEGILLGNDEQIRRLIRFSGCRVRAGGGFIASKVIDGKIPEPHLPTSAGPITPAFDRDAGEEIIVSIGVIVICKRVAVIRLSAEKVEIQGEVAEIVPLFAGRRAGEVVVGPTEGPFA